MKRLRLAVIGAGHLGRIHARLAAANEQFELVAVVDPLPAAASALGAELNVASHQDHRSLLGHIDAAVVATPTQTHCAVARELIAHGTHVLVEKPISISVADGQQLVEQADRAGVVLQVGHIERFNPAFVVASEHLANPRYIESRRYSGYTFRSTDIGVVLDLMIHDLDVALALADSPVVEVSALGTPVIGPHEDVATARLTFANGCVANLSASRVSFQACREMHVWQSAGFVAIDFAARRAKVIRPSAEIMSGRLDPVALSAEEKTAIRDRLFTDYLPIETLAGEDRNALADEQSDFAQAIRTGQSPKVTGRQAVAALAMAERILSSIAEHAWQPHTIVPRPHWNLGLPADAPRRQAG